MSDRDDAGFRAVLAERRARYRERPAAEREAAFRERAWLQAVLQACTCSWPVVRAETSTEHEPWCTAHRWIEQRRNASPIANGSPATHTTEGT